MTSENMLAIIEPADTLKEQAEVEAVLKPVVNAIERLETVVETETQLLLEGAHPDLADINARKSRGLYDFTRAMNKASARAEASALRTLQPLLDRLRQKLERNCEALQLHLRAVGELSDIIRTAIETHEADGTYTLRDARAGQTL
ncbi:flagellar protein FlgN [Brucella sp. IR073]|uniref:flagellar protein FlgN n=1 Tax=unclassified Brucella TaxID=2632610 RepID=UPI003B986E82